MAVTGKLMWGQSGTYDAVDDRLALSVAMQGTPGLWQPPWLSAGSGLNVIAHGGFAAGVDCGDGTLAVAATKDDLTVPFAAGTSQGRSEEIWLEVDPNAATWEVSAQPWQAAWNGQVGTGLGLSLGSVWIPAGASNAGLFTFTRSLSSMGSIRNYRNSSERRYFENQNPYRAWGSLTGLSDEQRMDILWNDHYYQFFRGDSPNYTQAGTLWATTDANGFAEFNFPIPFSAQPTVTTAVNETRYDSQIATATHVIVQGVSSTALAFRALIGSGQWYGSSWVGISWIAVGPMDMGGVGS